MLQSPTREQAAQAVAQRMNQVLHDEQITSQTPLGDIDTDPLDFVRQTVTRFNQKSVDRWQFNPTSDQYLADFITFCRNGPFKIH